MSSVFWEAKGILLIDYLEKSKPITSEYYSNPLHQLDAKICEKRPALKKKKTSFFRTTQLCRKWVVEKGNKIPSVDQLVEVQPPGGYGTFFSMNSAMLSDSDNVTAFEVTDAPRVEVRAHGEKRPKCQEPILGSRTPDLKGSQIEDLLCGNDLSILNDKRSTYLSKTNGTTSALDITAINHQTASQATWKILKSANSDHFPIITSIDQRVDGTIQSKRSWNFRKANWGKFTSELEILCSLSSPHTLDERLQSFALHINAAAKRSIPRVKRRND
ncbi:reverse transcriptase domain-containing protein [Trichonephila clavipes]|nr:reverse transcriptase domain-containing protein [Trichonephila clavipes]